MARNSELVLNAMLKAAKADGRVEETEIRRILGKVQEVGADQQALDEEAHGDRPAEKQYLEELASALGLEPEVTQSIHQEFGLQAS